LATVSRIPGTDLRISSLIDIADQKHAEDQLKKRERSLERESRRLKEANIALKVLLKQRTEDRREMEKKVLSNVRRLVFPYMAKLKKTPLSPTQSSLLQIAEKNLQNVISPFLQTLSAHYPALTPRETDIVNLVKEGKTAKEIAELLNSSVRSVEFHKNNIRQKLGLRNQKTGLRSHLLS
jgi:DNA-binding CsgD family transcriptional regulator